MPNILIVVLITGAPRASLNPHSKIFTAGPHFFFPGPRDGFGGGGVVR
jgi:hypothetical protein